VKRRGASFRSWQRAVVVRGAHPRAAVRQLPGHGVRGHRSLDGQAALPARDPSHLRRGRAGADAAAEPGGRGPASRRPALPRRLHAGHRHKQTHRPTQGTTWVVCSSG
jgi:hypothetical protein